MTRSSKLAFAAAVALALPAAAHVIGPRAAMRRFAEKQATEKQAPATLVGRAWLAGPGPEGRNAPAKVEVGAGTCSVRLELPEGNVGATWANGAVTTEGGADAAAVGALVALSCPLLTMHGVPPSEAEAAVSKIANSLRVAQNRVALARADGRVAFAVGGQPRDLASPQIWIEKSTSRPMRVIAAYGGKPYDVLFTDTHSIATAGAFPRLTEVSSGGEKQLTLRVMTRSSGSASAKPEEGDGAEDEAGE